jgi:hypothetical protein
LERKKHSLFTNYMLVCTETNPTQEFREMFTPTSLLKNKWHGSSGVSQWNIFIGVSPVTCHQWSGSSGVAPVTCLHWCVSSDMSPVECLHWCVSSDMSPVECLQQHVSNDMSPGAITLKHNFKKMPLVTTKTMVSRKESKYDHGTLQ